MPSKAKLVLCGLFFFFFLNITCDRQNISSFSTQGFLSSLRNREALLTVLASARLRYQQHSLYGFWWKEEKKATLAMRFSRFLFVLTLIHSALQLEGKCLPLVFCNAVCERLLGN